MARRIDIKQLMQSKFIRELPLVIFGCAAAALAIDMFMVPNGLAAGGVTGLATIVQELAARRGLSIPVGIQTIAINAVLLLVVVRSGGARYAVQTVTGFVLLGVFCDLFAPFVLPLGSSDLMLAALWGGIISGFGYGLVLRTGANTGGSDTIAQILSRKTAFPVGTAVMAIDVAICALSAPVFGVANALYAALSMVLCGVVVDMVVDGGNRRRAVYIISEANAAIADDIMYGLDRGCTELSARGCYTGEQRPVLMVILERGEIASLKTIVEEHDKNAIVIISDVSEAFGEGFKMLGRD